MTIEQQIKDRLSCLSYPAYSEDLADGIDRPRPSVRRTLTKMFREGDVTREGNSYWGYRYSIKR